MLGELIDYATLLQSLAMTVRFRLAEYGTTMSIIGAPLARAAKGASMTSSRMISDTFPIHDLESAPAGSRPALQRLKAGLGFIPNVAGAMATSPVLVEAFSQVFAAVHSGSFTEAELQVILLTNAVANRAAWPVALHTHLGLAAGVSAADVAAIRAGRAPEAARYRALSDLARTLIERRGQLDDATLGRLETAAVPPEQVLEVILVVAASTMTNYTATLTCPPLEAAIQPHAWGG